MNGVVRSEMLRSVSGFSMLAVALIALLLPVFVLVSHGERLDLTGLDGPTATARLLEPLAWSAVSAAFVSAYGVTRETYYASMDRTLAGVAFPRAFAGKLISGALVSLALSVLLDLVWTVAVSAALTQSGLSLALTPDTARLYAGALLGAVLGALCGGAVGWIARNYYVAAAVILVLPMALDFALLRAMPEIARFSPSLVLVALGVPGHEYRLLAFGPALSAALVWTAGLIAVAWIRGRRSLV